MTHNNGRRLACKSPRNTLASCQRSGPLEHTTLALRCAVALRFELRVQKVEQSVVEFVHRPVDTQRLDAAL